MQSAKKIGKYEIGRVLGKGNFSKVRVATDSTNGERYAIKIIDKALLTRDHLEDQIRREISILKVLRHKYIVQMREAFQTTKHMYVVMELVEGGELFDVVAEKGRLSEDETRKYFQQLIVAVRYCHLNKIAHRDLKLENLLLDQRGNLKVTDFGLANMQSTPDASVMRTVCGTPNYVAPEVIRMNSVPRNPQTGERASGYNGFTADVWSCGIILFIMLSGRQAFDDDDIKALFNKIERGQYQMSRHISDGPKSLIERMLCTDPAQRITINDIIKHPWFQVGFDNSELTSGIERPVMDEEEAARNAVTNVDGQLSPVMSPGRQSIVAPGPASRVQLPGSMSPASLSLSESGTANSGDATLSPGARAAAAAARAGVALAPDGVDGFQLANMLIASALVSPPFVDLGSFAPAGAAAGSGATPKKASMSPTGVSPAAATSAYPVFGSIRHFVVSANAAQAHGIAAEWLRSVLPSALRGATASQSTSDLRGFLTTPRGIMTFNLEVQQLLTAGMALITVRRGMGDSADFIETMRGLARRLAEVRVLVSQYDAAPTEPAAAASPGPTSAVVTPPPLNPGSPGAAASPQTPASVRPRGSSMATSSAGSSAQSSPLGASTTSASLPPIANPRKVVGPPAKP
jgi:5'-AMP-activated protein kinase catalytic alpha subunit